MISQLASMAVLNWMLLADSLSATGLHDDIDYGSKVYSDGSTYTGHFKNGQRHGMGILLYTSGPFAGIFSYDGMWERDQPSGSGRMVYTDETIYEGEWEAGLRSGQGYFSSSLYKFNGSWENDQMKYGTLSLSDGEVFDGHFLDNSFFDGSFLWPNNDHYNGQFSAWLMHGQGSYNWYNGLSYSGEWEYGTFHGSGTLHFNETVSVTGAWIDGSLQMDSAVCSVKTNSGLSIRVCNTLPKELLRQQFGHYVTFHCASKICEDHPSSYKNTTLMLHSTVSIGPCQICQLMYPIKLRQDFIFSNTEEANHVVTLGSGYGAWSIVPRVNLMQATIVSCGLGEDASFDVEIAALFDAVVVIVDPTPKSVIHFEHIKSRFGEDASQSYSMTGVQPVQAYNMSLLSNSNFMYMNKALWVDNKPMKFYKPRNKEHVSHTIVDKVALEIDTAATAVADTDSAPRDNFIWVDAVTPTQLLVELHRMKDQGVLHASMPPPLLKLDIEGAEFAVLESMFPIREGSSSATVHTRGSDASTSSSTGTPDDNYSSTEYAEWYPEQILVEFDSIMRPEATSVQRRQVAQTHSILESHGYRLIHTDGKANFLYYRYPHVLVV